MRRWIQAAFFWCSSDGNFIFCGKADFGLLREQRSSAGLALCIPQSPQFLGFFQWECSSPTSCSAEGDKFSAQHHLQIVIVTLGKLQPLWGARGWMGQPKAIPWDQGCWESSDPHVQQSQALSGPASPALFRDGDELVP